MKTLQKTLRDITFQMTNLSSTAGMEIESKRQEKLFSMLSKTSKTRSTTTTIPKPSLASLEPVSATFKESLSRDIRAGLRAQRDKILVLETKTLSFSAAIQHQVNEVINREKNEEDGEWLDSAIHAADGGGKCCLTPIQESIYDFLRGETHNVLSDYNEYVAKVSNILADIRENYTQPVLLCSSKNTQLYFPY
jgi:hypothetical protein